MMPADVTETVIWTCVAAFVVCMIAVGLFGFATEFGLSRIQDRLMPWAR